MPHFSAHDGRQSERADLGSVPFPAMIDARNTESAIRSSDGPLPWLRSVVGAGYCSAIQIRRSACTRDRGRPPPCRRHPPPYTALVATTRCLGRNARLRRWGPGGPPPGKQPPPGHIALSQAARRPAWRVATESRRNELAGFRYSAGVDTIRISGIGGRMEGQPRAAPALVGRDGELGELLAGIDDVASGRGRLFLLAGDPGIGKSRLAYEAAARARDRGIKVEWGRCWEAGGAPDVHPVSLTRRHRTHRRTLGPHQGGTGSRGCPRCWTSR